MCLILDASLFHQFNNRKNADMKLIRKWHKDKKNKFVYSKTTNLMRELNNCSEMVKYFNDLSLSGKIIYINKNKVQKKEDALRNEKDPSKKLKSNDAHIIALALVSKVKLLVTADQSLHKDFKSNIKKGKIYQYKEQYRLLKPCTLKL